MTRTAIVIGALVALLGNFSVVSAQKPGDKPPADRHERIQLASRALEQALAAKDEQAAYKAVSQLREALGPYAGVPESPEKYFKPVDVTTPELQPLIAEWDAMFRKGLADRGSRSEIAKKNQMELRESAYIAIGCLAVADAELPAAKEYLARAREELDYLVSRQHASGMFPYPADPQGSAPPNMRKEAETIRRTRPEAIQNGYIVIEDAGTQFDTGCCSYALAEGYRMTRDARYLAAAKKAGGWAIRMGLSPNWNYNSFSVWQLAKLYSITGDKKYLDSAVEKATIGVISGLMETGHWVDQHNAKQSYHWIMVRALNELLRVLPTEHPRYGVMKEKMMLAADTRAAEIVRDGVSNIESALVALSVILEQFGPNETWEHAANAVVNAMQSAKQPNPIALPIYIRYRCVKEMRDRFASYEPGDQSPSALTDRADVVTQSLRSITDPAKRKELADILASAEALYNEGKVEMIGKMLSYTESEIAKHGKLIERTERQPIQKLSAEQTKRMATLVPQLRDAMIAKDGTKVRNIVREAIQVLGAEAGKPEEGLFIHTDFSTEAKYDLPEAQALWQKCLERALERGAAHFDDAPTGKVTLRHYAWELFNLIALYERTDDAATKARLAGIIRRGLDAIVSVQASNGVFGFPYDPTSRERLRQMGARIVKEGEGRGIKMVENGWIIEDLGDGGLQFDNGLCGTAVTMGYRALHDQKYLDSAKRCAQYVRRIPVVPNWNYNSFSARFLANLYGVTKDNTVLNVLAEKLDLGVLPGIMDNGRYFDAHNAKTVYHCIIVESLLAASQVMPKDHPRYAETVRAAKLTIENLAREVLSAGPNHFDRSLGIFSRYLMWFGPNDDVEKALNATANELFGSVTPESTGSGDMEMVAYQLGFYLDYKSAGKKP